MGILIAVFLNLPHLVPNALVFLKHPKWAKGYHFNNDIRTFRFSLVMFFLPWKRTHPLFHVLSLPVYRRLGMYPGVEPFLGYLLLGLSIYGWIRYPRKAGVWMVPGIVFFLWSLGPDIKLTPGSKAILPAPYRLVMILPILNTLRNPSRFILVTQICMGISAGYGAFGVLCRLKRAKVFLKRKKMLVYLLAVLFACVHILELSLFPYPSTDPHHCAYYPEIRKDPADVAVLDCPMQTGLQCHMYFTRLHRKRAIHGFGGRVWFPDLWRHEDPFYMEKFLPGIPREKWDEYKRKLEDAMYKARVKYVIVHKWLYPGADSYKIVREFLENKPLWENREKFEKILKVYEDETHIVYEAVPLGCVR